MAILSLVVPFLLQANEYGLRKDILLENGWQFCRGEESPESVWKDVTVPHDWAIYGPFDRGNDLQNVTVTQNNETKASLKTGRTGGLPHIGTGIYRRDVELSEEDLSGKSVGLLFDGAMSNAKVYVNGILVGSRPYGYSAFYCDLSSVARIGRNSIKVHLENKPESFRWYPGAGLYRNVHLIVTDKVHVPVWGTKVAIGHSGPDFASVRLDVSVDGLPSGSVISVLTRIKDGNGRIVASKTDTGRIYDKLPFRQNFIVEKPVLWSPENPSLYSAESEIFLNGRKTDLYTTVFGIRSAEFIPDRGFFLNGRMRKIHGVCLHNDLGPLGAGINVSALKYRLKLLKDMGCDAIRTAHNIPSPELVSLCDSLGFMMILETFDSWSIPKNRNGYNLYFDEWVDADVRDMVRQFRNHPSVIMWSIGNEVGEQRTAEGYETALRLENLCHEEDPSRPVTCGMDQVHSVLDNGFAAALDIPGFNYKVPYYKKAHSVLPQGLLFASESSSTVSSRGVYFFPIEKKGDVMHPDHQSSSYDTEYCSWSNIPDDDLAADEDYPWVIGQFVWSGFDYLGEPSPYDTDAWPSHSSLFGIIDLAYIPKDRYYLYRSIWNSSSPTLHILPHWTWPGREGKTTPVFVYTSYPEVELFVNGKSYGRHRKNNSSEMARFRLMWDDVVYEPGELKAIAYGNDGKKISEEVIRTAGKPDHLVILPDRTALSANGKDLAFVNVKVVDRDGNLCPSDNRLVKFTVKGEGTFEASANGDPTCLDSFRLPEMHIFSGELTAIVRSSSAKGDMTFTASAKGLGKASVTIHVF